MISCCIPQEVRQTSEYGFDIDGRDGIIVINQSLSSKEHSGAVCVTRLIGFREDRTQCQLHSFYNSSVRNRDIIKEHYSELKAVAELWHKIGWRECVVSNEEIACSGCSLHKQCTYQLVDCTREHSVYKCNQCDEFPCGKINAMLERSIEYKKKCKEVCSEQEYIILEKAFFEKENNLKK